MEIGRTPEEFTGYVKRLEELAWWTVGSSAEFEHLMEEAKLEQVTYLEALERLILARNDGAD